MTQEPDEPEARQIDSTELFSLLLDSLKVRCQKIHKKDTQLSHDYTLAIRNLLPMSKGLNNEQVNTHVMMLAGSIPTIVVSIGFLGLVNQKDGSEIINKGLESALRLVPRMTRTLALVPIKDAIALREGVSKWTNASRHKLAVEIPERYFDTSYDVTVRCTLSNQVLTQHGILERDVEKTKAALKVKLSTIALSDPTILEILEDYERERALPKRLQVPSNMYLVANRRGVDISSALNSDDNSDDSVSLKDIPKGAE